ncbi:MAG: Phosphate-binding protein PstS 1 precursor, partial [Cyanobacteriota bacterium]
PISEPSAPEPSAPEPSVTETLAEGAPPEEVESAPALAPEPAPTTADGDLNPAPVVATPTAEALAEPPDEVSTPLGDIPIPQPSAVPVIAIAGAAGLAAGAAASMASTEDQSAIEARKFDVVGQPTDGSIDLSSIDDGLPPLPDGYGESRIVLMPRDPQWAYLYWDIPHTHKENLRRQGGERLALRLYDVTDIDRNYQAPHGMQQCDCDELARDWYLQIPVSDRDYQAEIGYLTHDGRWLLLARSNTIRIPPIYPSDWSEDHFKTVTWEEDLRGKTLMPLVDPSQKSRSLHEQMYALSQAGEAERVDGSIYGSMQHVPGSVPHVPGSVSHVAGSIQQVPGSIQHVAGSMAPYQSAESSYAWGASGAGLLHGMPGPGGAVPTMSGIGMMSGVGMGVTMSGIGMMSGVGMGVTMSGAGISGVGMSGIGMSGIGMSGMNVSGLNMSGLNMSGLSGLTMSGVGFSASMPPARPRQFWLVADAELIVYGATEADATVTIAGQPTQLSPEGTFRVHTSFPDGNIDYPIMAVAADGEQSRSIHMTFDRQTPDRRTNTKEEAQDEWFEG